MNAYFSHTDSYTATIFPPRTESSWLGIAQTAIVKKAVTLFSQNDDPAMNTKPFNLKINRVPLTKIRGMVNPQWIMCFEDKLRPLQPQSWLQRQLNRKIEDPRPHIVLVQIGDLYFVCEGMDYVKEAREAKATALDALVAELSSGDRTGLSKFYYQ